MTKNLYQIVDNPLGQITDWGEHQKLLVGIHGKYTYNRTPVFGIIQIGQLSADDVDVLSEDGPLDDFRDFEFESNIVTTAAGARLLAELLIKAAEQSEQLESPVQ